MKKCCGANADFMLIGKWSNGDYDDDVVFTSDISNKGCKCSPESVFKFYKSSPNLQLALVPKTNTKETLYYGEKYNRPLTGAKVKAFFPTIMKQKDQDGQAFERGQINEISAALFTRRTGGYPSKVT